MKYLVILVSVFAVVSAAALDDFDNTLELWKNGDWKVQQLRHQEYLGYSDEQLSRLVPVMAQWITIRTELDKHPNVSWKVFESEHDWTPFLNALPSEHPIRKRWGLSHEAASVIRVLSEERRIQDESILPVLIDGVMHPSSSFTGRDCFYSLTALLKLYDGALTSWGSLGNGTKESEKISEWFRSWYKSNQGGQMIVTVELEKQIKREYLLLTSRLEQLVSDPSHSLHGFRAPNEKDYHKVGQPLFDVQWDGRFRSRRPGDAHGNGWVWVMVRPQTELIEGIEAWDRYPSWDASKALPEGGRLIYRKRIKNSDWALEVYVNRLSKDEITNLDSGLHENAEQASGADAPPRAAHPCR